MENEKTFGRFLISKRQENEISARQLAIALDYSAVYICDIEKDRRPVPDEILERGLFRQALGTARAFEGVHRI